MRGLVHSVIQARAEEVGAPLTVVPALDVYEGGASLPLGLAGAHQRVNAALAVALAAAWEAQHAQHAHASGHAATAAGERAEAVARLRLPEAYREGLQACYWPGRAEVIAGMPTCTPGCQVLSPSLYES